MSNPYSYHSSDGHEYFVLRINNRETAGYAIYDEKGKRADNNRQFADGYETAEDAQAALDSMAAERGWVKA